MARSTTSRTGWWMFNSESYLWQNTAGSTAITADGQTILRCDDQNGSSRNMTTATNGPLWKSPSGLLLPAARFDGSNDRLYYGTATNLFTTTGKTIAIACRFLAGFTNVAAIYDNTGIAINASEAVGSWSYGIYGKTIAGVHRVYAYNWDGNEDVTTGIEVSLNTNYVLVMTHDGTTVSFSLNGGTPVTVSSGTTQVPGPGFMIGGNGTNTGKFANIEIGEVAAYNAAITGTALSDTIAAMMADWVIPSSWMVPQPLITYPRRRPIAY